MSLYRVRRSRVILVGFLALSVVFASACSTSKKMARGKDSEKSSGRSQMLPSERPSVNSTPMVSVVRPKEIVVRGVSLKNTEFDFPITLNSKVESWIDYFTGRGRKHFEKYLERSELFIPYIRPILKDQGLPEDLVYLAMIESGFNNHAKSHAKAVGPWQFISATGKRYGLGVNWWVDERRDTKKSTLAAAAYLKDLYKMFNSWELAAAGYNAGEMKIVKAIRRYGTQDFWAISRQSFLRPETRDYVPKIIAAALVAKNREQFGFKASSLVPSEGEAVAPDGEVVKLEAAHAQSPSQASKEALESVLREETGPKDETIEVGVIETTKEPEGADGSEPKARSITTPHVNKEGKLVGEELLDFEVRSPADLTKIALASGLSYHTVKSLNPELLRWCTPPHKKTYQIRLPASVKDKFLKVYNSPDFDRQIEFLAFRVKKSQPLASVARRFGLKVDPLADLNRISPKTFVGSGKVIKLPIPVDRARNIAALEIRDPPEYRGRRRPTVKRKKSPRSDNKVTFDTRSYSRYSSSFYR